MAESIASLTISALRTGVTSGLLLAAAGASEAQVTTRDSLGVEIVETAGTTARAPASLSVDSEPDLQIGALDGDPPYVFADIQHVRVLSEERILVVDRRSSELRFYNFGGDFIALRGRQERDRASSRSPSS